MIIDQLPLLGGDVQGTDEFPIERGTTTYKTTQAALVKTATDAAAAAQAAADDAQETADEANEKGLPPGGTAGQVLTKAGSADYSASWEDPSGGDVTANMLGIVINGDSTPVGASVGQYVIVKNSTITGITDGLYTAVNALSPSTGVTAADLTAVSDGGLNGLRSVYSDTIILNGWVAPAFRILGYGTFFDLPLPYPYKEVKSYNFTTVKLYDNRTWKDVSISYCSVPRDAILYPNYIRILFDLNGVTITQDFLLAHLVGTIVLE